MLTEYIRTALNKAHYEIMENGRYCGKIPGIQGIWADAETLEQCRERLREVFEDWLIVGLRDGITFPVLDGIDFNKEKRIRMELNKQCFKIDRPNAFAMINGYYVRERLNQQTIWCDVKLRPFPMLITLNRAPTRFGVSQLHRKAFLEEFRIPYKYIADYDCEYLIKNDMRLWEKICNNGLFDIWDPMSPYKRFAGSRSDPTSFRIQLLRIYEINEEYDESEIEHRGSYTVNLIAENRSITIKRPVIPKGEFIQIRSLLEKSILPFRQ